MLVLETIEQGVEYCMRFRNQLAEAEDCVITASKTVVKAEEGIPRQVAMQRLKYWVQVYEDLKERINE